MSPPHILVVDDNDDNLELMRFLLGAAGYPVVLAGGGTEAIALAVRRPPDLVLMDIQMPDVDGYQAAAWIRAQPKLGGVVLVAVTAFAMVGDRDHVLAGGFDGYIAKPISPRTFVEDVERYLSPMGRIRLARTAGS
ncbi:MAG: two-component system, cell cycle response regulator [Solirubrobacteraceae bacterium]|nr:two-component system, cell cycle response regulator [Solirubrobacteraceae bacterium]